MPLDKYSDFLQEAKNMYILMHNARLMANAFNRDSTDPEIVHIKIKIEHYDNWHKEISQYESRTRISDIGRLYADVKMDLLQLVKQFLLTAISNCKTDCAKPKAGECIDNIEKYINTNGVCFMKLMDETARSELLQSIVEARELINQYNQHHNEAQYHQDQLHRLREECTTLRGKKHELEDSIENLTTKHAAIIQAAAAAEDKMKLQDDTRAAETQITIMENDISRFEQYIDKLKNSDSKTAAKELVSDIKNSFTSYKSSAQSLAPKEQFKVAITTAFKEALPKLEEDLPLYQKAFNFLKNILKEIGFTINENSFFHSDIAARSLSFQEQLTEISPPKLK